MSGYGYTVFDTAIGRCGIAWGEFGVIGVQLPEAREIDTRRRLYRLYPEAREQRPPLNSEIAIEGIVTLLRGGNADLNMTFAMASIFTVLWLIWALRSNGIRGFALHIFGPKGESSGFIKYMMVVIFFFVGFLELISIAFRPVSLSFRLYGNIFAGENLLEAMSNVVQHPAWAKAVFSVLLPVPFYFLELLVGLVQAFVFMLLTTVFTALICTHEEEHAQEHH